MTLLFPAMLAGLFALAVPVVFHLLARHKYPVRDFPSIRLLRYEKRDNAFARRLREPWQLVLRLLVLLLLVLAMSRALVRVPAASAAPRNLVLVLDASASMLMAPESDRSATPLARAELLVDHQLDLLSQLEVQRLKTVAVKRAVRHGSSPRERGGKCWVIRLYQQVKFIIGTLKARVKA